MTAWRYPITLYDKQRYAVASNADEVLFGGSLAGGKTEMILKHMVDICLLIPNAKTLVIRKSFPQMVEIEQRLRTRIPKEVAYLNKSEHVLHFKHNGAELHLGYLSSIEDAERYQGHEYVKIGFDELTHYDKEWVAEVQSRIRGSAETQGIMDSYGLTMGMLAASNPGSRGHQWVKSTYIDPAPAGTEFVGDDGVRRIFIPSSLYDNPFINHEDYIRRLGNLDPVRKRALIEGDWSIPAGVRFPQFRESVHTLAPEDFPIDPVGIVRTVGVDFGFSDPYAAVWLAKVGEYIIAYRDDVKDELTAAQQAARILDMEAEGERAPNRPVTIALDPAAWRRDPNHVGPKLGGEDAPLGSMAWHYQEVTAGKGGAVVKGINDRVHGWATIDELLLPQPTGGVDPETGEPEMLPRLLIYNTCRQLIRALQSAPRSKTKPEDVQSAPKWNDDHVLDALRYGVMELLGRDYVRKPTGEEQAARAALDRRTETGDLQSIGF